jgi:hypothetical protein
MADTWFSCEESFQKLDEMGIKFAMEIKSNRIVYSRGKKIIGQSVSKFFEGIKRKKIYFRGRPKWASSATLKFKDSTMRLKTVAVANKKGLSNKPFSYYVSNQLTWDERKIWSLARYRWSIEVQFRELKQLFALGKAAVRTKEAVETTISMSMIALTVVRQIQYEGSDASKNQHKRPKPASTIAHEIKLDSLKTLTSKLASSGEVVLLRKFQKKLSKKNLLSKPTVDFDMTG